MALKDGIRVWETTTTTGSGTLNLGGAVTGYQAFVANLGTGNTCIYTLLDANGVDWECGIGTLTGGTPDTLARTTCLASSNSGSPISLTTGTHQVFIGPVAGYATGSTNMLDLILQRPELKDVAETVATPALSAGALTVDFEAGNVKDIAHDSNITGITISNPPASGKCGSMTLVLTQDATGGRTIAGWPASVKWSGGSAPTFSTTANKKNVVVLLTTDGGTTYLAWLAGKDFA